MSCYRLGQAQNQTPVSWEFVGLSLVWGALWPVMLLLRWSEQSWRAITRGLRDGSRGQGADEPQEAAEDDLEAWLRTDEEPERVEGVRSRWDEP